MEFDELYKNAKKWHCCGVLIFYETYESMKVAFVASKKVCKAVQMNRAKRLLREIFFSLKTELKLGRYILVAKSDICTMSFLELKKNTKWGLKKLKCLDWFYLVCWNFIKDTLVRIKLGLVVFIQAALNMLCGSLGKEISS